MRQCRFLFREAASTFKSKFSAFVEKFPEFLVEDR